MLHNPCPIIPYLTQALFHHSLSTKLVPHQSFWYTNQSPAIHYPIQPISHYSLCYTIYPLRYIMLYDQSPIIPSDTQSIPNIHNTPQPIPHHSLYYTTHSRHLLWYKTSPPLSNMLQNQSLTILYTAWTVCPSLFLMLG